MKTEFILLSSPAASRSVNFTEVWSTEEIWDGRPF